MRVGRARLLACLGATAREPGPRSGPSRRPAQQQGEEEMRQRVHLAMSMLVAPLYHTCQPRSFVHVEPVIRFAPALSPRALAAGAVGAMTPLALLGRGDSAGQ